MAIATAGTFWGMLTQSQKDEVLEMVAEEAAILLDVYIEAIIEGSGLPELEGMDRLEAYRQREGQIWARLQAEFPKDYERQMKDWGKLESRMVKHPIAAYSTTDRAIRGAARATPLGY